MKWSRFFLIAGCFTFALAVLTTCQGGNGAVKGRVVDESGQPVVGASVIIQGTANKTLTDITGTFFLEGLPADRAVTVSAWSEGYYCAKLESVRPPRTDLLLVLRLYQINDNPDYTWIPPVGENSCYSCKPGVTEVWLENDVHSRSATNARYLTMYNGTDVNGNRSPLTSYHSSIDYGRVPIPPDLSQPYYGPGYKLDFPESMGNCAACHNPGAAVDAPYQTDPNMVSGADAYGVHCDYCHKIAAINLDLATGLPYINRPGVLSQELRRPFTDDEDRYQLFFGSFADDNVPMEDTYLPLLRQSQFCAPCHYGVFWDTLVYNSYGEWLESSYSDPQTGKTCQNCHMSVPTVLDGVALTNVAPGKGGIVRDPLTISAHDFPGGGSIRLLQNSVNLNVQASKKDALVSVLVTITNDKAGHHVPTDSPLRQMILLVEVLDCSGELQELLEGPVLPEWAGVGDPQNGYYAGLPGKLFAKTLMERWTNVVPSSAYWNPTLVVSDTRLAAGANDTSAYLFSHTGSDDLQVSIRLFYRRAFIELMDQKGWNVPDILMESCTIILGD
jgi:hypothetical protein